MFFRKLMTAGVLSGALIVPSLASAADSAPQSSCIFREHRVVSVHPYETERHIGRVSVKELRGAELFVQAEPGLTAEWLRLSLERHIAQMHRSPMGNCPLDVNDVRIQVQSAGTGFAVRIITKDSDRGKEVLRRAKLLVG